MVQHEKWQKIETDDTKALAELLESEK